MKIKQYFIDLKTKADNGNIPYSAILWILLTLGGLITLIFISL